MTMPRQTLTGAIGRLRELARERLPQITGIKRRVSASWYAALPPRDSYSQHGEDRLFRRLLQGYDLSGGFYIDVGANHPVTQSNTYLFYRSGFRGVTVEPIFELATLLRSVRPRDIVLAAACDSKPGIAELSIARTLADSSLEEVTINPWRREFTPIITVDQILDACEPDWIFLFSVDVEGRDLAVLEGAERTLAHTLLVCVEANTGQAATVIRSHMERLNFEEIDETGQIGPNLVFRNRSDSFEIYRV